MSIILFHYVSSMSKHRSVVFFCQANVWNALLFARMLLAPGPITGLSLGYLDIATSQFRKFKCKAQPWIRLQLSTCHQALQQRDSLSQPLVLSATRVSVFGLPFALIFLTVRRRRFQHPFELSFPLVGFAVISAKLQRKLRRQGTHTPLSSCKSVLLRGRSLTYH